MTSHPSAPTSSQRRPGSGRRSRRFVTAAAALAVALAVLVATTGVAGAREGGQAATPTKGGTLKLLGTGDIFNLDTVSAYYTVSSLLERAFTRQLVSYPNAPSFLDSIKLVPDIATAVPVKGNGISADGKTYTFKLRSGVKWNTTPARAVTAADFVLEFKMLCNPGRAERGARLLHEHHRRHEGATATASRRSRGRLRRSPPTSRRIRCPASSPRTRRPSSSSS